MARIGVFICHCGENIGATVDCAAVAEAAAELPGVVHSVDYKYMCSDPGQNMIQEAIREHTRPAWWWPPARRACTSRPSAGPAPRPGSTPTCARWPTCASTAPGCTRRARPPPRRPSTSCGMHGGEGQAQPAAASRSRCRSPRRALVIGGGIAGIQAALDIANAGHKVVLVEREPSHRRPHGPALRDLPHPGLLAVHPDAADGGGGPAPEHHAEHLLPRWRRSTASSATSR